MKLVRRRDAVFGIGGMAILLAFLSIPGHPLGTFFYDWMPAALRHTLKYGQHHSQEYWTEVKNQSLATVAAVVFGIVVFVPLGIVASRLSAVRVALTNLVGIARGIPPLAILFLVVPWIGQGLRPALVALIILASAPIFLNTIVGYAGVDPAVVESARGMGLNPWQILFRIETPLALPLLVAGIRTATVEVVASATIAYVINFDTLGYQIFNTAQYYYDPSQHPVDSLILGVASVAAMALFAELLLSVVQSMVSPPGAGGAGAWSRLFRAA